MKKNMFFMIVIVLLVGCSAGGMKEVHKSNFLGDYSMLGPGAEGQAALAYVKSGVDFKPYNKLMFERVVVVYSQNADHQNIDPTVLKELTDYYQKALLEAVKGGYEIVDKPGPGVMRVRVAITGVKPSKPLANTLSTITPVGWVTSGATKIASDDNVGTGEASSEMELLDAVTSERLAAAVDRRQGGKSAFRGKWDDTKDAFDFWAKRFRVRLDQARGI